MKYNAFLLIFLLTFQLALSNLFPHIIWLYWGSGFQKMGNFQKLCYYNIAQLHQNTDWRIYFVQDKTLSMFLNETNFKRFQTAVQNLGTKFYPPTKSDLVRFFLLKQNGGVWLDLSIILKQNLNWMDDLLNNPKVFHRKIFKKPEVFLNFQHRYGLEQQIIVKINQQNYYPLIQLQSPFFASVKQSKYINDLLTQFQELIINGQESYNKSKKNFYIPYKYNAYYIVYRAGTVAQYKKFAEYKEKLGSKQIIQNLESYFYNYLTISSAAGIYHGSLDQQRVSRFLLSQEGPFGDFQTYVMKLYRHPRLFVTSILQNQSKQIQQWTKKINTKNYQFGQKYLTKQFECLYKLKVHENSAINKYFLFNKSRTNQFFPNVQIAKNSQLPLICKVITLKTFIWAYPIVLQWIKKAIIIALISSLFYQYLTFSFSSFQKDSLLKYKIFTKFIYLSSIYLQKELIYSQYLLWKQSSPTAVYVLVVEIITTFVMFKWFIDVGFIKNMQKYYWIRLVGLSLLQYYWLYINSVWKYEGQIYSYQVVALLNQKKIQEGVLYLIKIAILLTIFNILIFLEFCFNIFFAQKVEKQWMQKRKKEKYDQMKIYSDIKNEEISQANQIKSLKFQ